MSEDHDLQLHHLFLNNFSIKVVQDEIVDYFDDNMAIYINEAPPSLTPYLFVGQIPKSMEEDAIQQTGAHKGCASISFETKDEADSVINNLHNARILPPMSSPMQVKYADGELQRLHHKLFVGMLPKTVNEDNLREIFAPYGEIEEVTVLRDTSGNSKGCGFVKYKEREQALQAINMINGTVLPGAPKPLIVRIAETDQSKKEKQHLKLLANQANLLIAHLANNPAASAYANPYAAIPNPTTFLQPTATQAGSLANAYSNLANAYGSPTLATTYGAPGVATATPAAPLGYSTATPFFMAPAVQPAAASMDSPQKQGPPGANLFIYHLPQEWRDPDLIQTFAPYGNVISAKVFIDKNSMASKCFGFVSYDNPLSAAEAISKLNGLHVGSKRLKVEVKRNQSPY